MTILQQNFTNFLKKTTYIIGAKTPTNLSIKTGLLFFDKSEKWQKRELTVDINR